MPLAIAVVGFGVAGASAALLLAAQGHAVTLLEQAPTVAPVGAGVLLQPSGQWVLGQLGLLADTIRQAEPITRVLARTHRGGTLVDLRYPELHPSFRAYGLHRGDLFTVLQQAVARAGITVRLGCRITEVTVGAAGGAMQLRDAAATQHGPFDLLIAADGSRSALRVASGATHRATPYRHGALWAVGRSTAVRGHLLQITRGTRRLCGMLPVGEGRCSLFWSLHAADHPRVLDRGIAAFKEEVLALCPDAAELLQGVRSLDELRFTTYQYVRMARLFHGRCLFLGDAAHAMSPHLGQGINLALLDAYLFSRCLAEEGEAGDRVGRALLRYQQERSGPLRFYSWLTYLLSPFFQSQGVVKGVLRDLFLPLLPRVGPLRRQMLLSVAGLKAGWLAGTLPLLQATQRPELPARP